MVVNSETLRKKCSGHDCKVGTYYVFMHLWSAILDMSRVLQITDNIWTSKCKVSRCCVLRDIENVNAFFQRLKCYDQDEC